MLAVPTEQEQRTLPSAAYNMDHDKENNNGIRPQPGKCHLLRLPREIRLRIYGYLLKSPSSIKVQRTLTSSRSRRPSANPHLLHPAILSTCRIIHHEATSVLYGQNLFQSQSGHRGRSLDVFQARIGLANAAAIKTFRLINLADDSLKSFRKDLEILETYCPSLRTLVVFLGGCPEQIYNSPSMRLLEKTPEMFPDLGGLHLHSWICGRSVIDWV
ncbi:MAG: hypothetical protein M1825_002036 [Sarcosagium campestre]|nr:MAG: hypothetical protein M1825_002036 [Sarcosagium campestre]